MKNRLGRGGGGGDCSQFDRLRNYTGFVMAWIACFVQVHFEV